MEILAITWLSASATAPLLVVLSVWVLYVFHSYRRKWRSVDLFLLAVASQQLVTALFCFGFSLLSLIGPRLEAPCGFILWGLTASRTFQMTTLASAVVDRALTVRWPYRYRFSVRRNQIRYHIAVLAIIGVFIGIAAVFARSAASLEQCSVHPLRWDRRYTVFIIALYGLLVLSSVGCCVLVEVQRCVGVKQSQLKRTSSPEYGTASTGSSVSSGSTKPLHMLWRQTSKRPYSPGVLGAGLGSSGGEFRWTVVAVVTSISLAINHFPYLVLVILGAYIENFWTPWHEVAIIWLRLAEGFVFPIILCLTDIPHWSAVKKALKRKGASADFTSEDSRFRLYMDDSKSYIKNFGPVAPIGIITNYKRASLKGISKNSKNSWKGSHGKNKYIIPSIYGIDCVLEKPGKLRSGLQATEMMTEKPPLEHDAYAIDCSKKFSSMEVDFNKYCDDSPWGGDNEDSESHIYATLSDTCSFQSTIAGDSVMTFSVDDDDTCAGSFTTDANDDFEFHDTRPCGGEVRMRHYDGTVQRSDHNDSGLQMGGGVSTDSLFLNSNGQVIRGCYDVRCDNSDNEDDSDDDDYRDDVDKNSFKAKRNTSFSMNDLDLIDDQSDVDENTESSTALPYKSESLVSLYRQFPDKQTKVNEGKTVPSSKEEPNTPLDDPYSLGQKVMEAIMRNGRSSFVIRRNYVRKAKKKVGLKRHKLVFDCDDNSNVGYPHNVNINAIRRIGSPTKQWRVPVDDLGYAVNRKPSLADNFRNPDRKLTVISEFI